VDWLASYLQYTNAQVSPRAFHFWSAAAVLGATLGRRCWLQRGAYGYLYPGQLWVVLVSKSAITKKTTAATLAVRMAKHLPPWSINILPAKTSPSQMLMALDRRSEIDRSPLMDPEGNRVDSTGFVFAGELGSFFTNDSFTENLAATFNELADCPQGKHRIEYRSWKIELWNPCVSLLGCITPKGIAEELPKAARKGGFFGRILWVCQQTSDRFNSLTDTHVEAAMEQLEAELRDDLESIAYMEGPFTFTKQSKAWMDDWYYQVYAKQLQAMDASAIEDTGYWGRKDAHLLRVGMVVSAARRRDRKILRADLEAALRELEIIERHFNDAMSELDMSPYSGLARKILEYVEVTSTDHRPWIGVPKLLKRMWRYCANGRRQFEDVLGMLEAAGEIATRQKGNETQVRRVLDRGAHLRGVPEEGHREETRE